MRGTRCGNDRNGAGVVRVKVIVERPAAGVVEGEVEEFPRLQILASIKAAPQTIRIFFFRVERVRGMHADRRPKRARRIVDEADASALRHGEFTWIEAFVGVGDSYVKVIGICFCVAYHAVSRGLRARRSVARKRDTILIDEVSAAYHHASCYCDENVREVLTHIWVQYNACMFSRKYAGAALIALLMATVSGGDIIHAAVPHHHGDDHAGQESAVWTSLHSALRHEQKKFLLVLTALLSIFLVVFASVRLLVVPVMRKVRMRFASARARDPVLGAALRTGILPHRRFG